MLREHDLLLVGLHHLELDKFAAVAVDGVRDVGIELGSAILVLDGTILAEGFAAVIAVAGSQVIFVVAARAAVHQPPAGHRDERASASLDDLQIPDDKAAVQRDGTESQQPLIGVAHQLDANFGDFHGSTPSLIEDSNRRPVVTIPLATGLAPDVYNGTSPLTGLEPHEKKAGLPRNGDRRKTQPATTSTHRPLCDSPTAPGNAASDNSRGSRLS